jgi:2-octaprenyl-6-methoxyphenol hydroxylase
MQKEYDIAIVGGGLVGASLACCLAQSKYRVLVIEQFSLNSDIQPSYDERGLALSLSSCRILDAIDIWKNLLDKAIPIRHIHVSDRGKFGFVRLHASDLHIDAMGYVVTAREIGKLLVQKISSIENIDYQCPKKVSGIEISDNWVSLGFSDDTSDLRSLRCKLLVAADGSNSCLRDEISVPAFTKDYEQSAIVSNITMDKDHENTAYERFTSDGPLALLPMSLSRFVSVNCVKSRKLDAYMKMDDEKYVKVLQEISGKRAGKIVKIGKLIRIESQFQGRTVFLGNAAHTIHPNGAQGFNLGLRDVAALAEVLLKHSNNCQDPGISQLLSDYVSLREQDQNKVIDFTDTIASLFYNDGMFNGIVRNIGMNILNMVPVLKNSFAKQAMGLGGKQPGLVRGLRLDQL